MARSDADLLELAGEGDRNAFGELYDRYASAAYRLAHRVTRDPRLAEDVVQEAFLAVWRQASRFDATRARPATWLLTITHHRAVDLVRREAVRRTERADDVADLPDSTDVHCEVWAGDCQESIRTALATLPSLQRQVIELSYFSGFSQTELARLLDQPLGTIKSRSHAALARLQVALEQAGAPRALLLGAD